MTDREEAYAAAGVVRGVGDKLLDDIEALAAEFRSRTEEHWQKCGSVMYSSTGLKASAEHAWQVSYVQGLAILLYHHLEHVVASAPPEIAPRVARVLVDSIVETIRRRLEQPQETVQ